MITPPPLRPGMLPPNPEPLPMPDLKDGESCWYEPPVRPEEGESGYWRFEDPLTAPSTGTEWVNESDFEESRPYYDAFYDSPTLPHFLSKRQVPKRMGEYRRGLSHMVSERVVDIFRAFDPDGFKTIEINMEFKDGARPPFRYFWMRIMRVIAAVDYANSWVRYQKWAGYPSVAVEFGSMRFMPEAYEYPYFSVAPAHKYPHIYVSEDMRQTLLKEKIRHLQFIDPACIIPTLPHRR